MSDVTVTTPPAPEATEAAAEAAVEIAEIQADRDVAIAEIQAEQAAETVEAIETASIERAEIHARSEEQWNALQQRLTTAEAEIQTLSTRVSSLEMATTTTQQTAAEATETAEAALTVATVAATEVLEPSKENAADQHSATPKSEQEKAEKPSRRKAAFRLV